MKNNINKSNINIKKIIIFISILFIIKNESGCKIEIFNTDNKIDNKIETKSSKLFRMGVVLVVASWFIFKIIKTNSSNINDFQPFSIKTEPIEHNTKPIEHELFCSYYMAKDKKFLNCIMSTIASAFFAKTFNNVFGEDEEDKEDKKDKEDKEKTDKLLAIIKNNQKYDELLKKLKNISNNK